MTKQINLRKTKITFTFHHRWEPVKTESDKFHKKKWNTNFDLGIWLTKETGYRHGITIGINFIVFKALFNFRKN